MMSVYYTVNQIYPWLYSIHDPQEVFCYLLVGSEKALLYDTCYGIAPLDVVVGSVTNLPFEVVLSHGHIDHVNGAYQFPEVWLHPADRELCLRHTSKTARRKIAENLGAQHTVQDPDPLKEPLPLDMVNENNTPTAFDANAWVPLGAGNLKDLPHGKIFDLGGLTVEVVAMEGHTPGSVGLLIHEHRVLLDSDAANHHIWMFLEESLGMDVYINMLRRVKELPFDTFFVGHQDNPRPKADFDKYIHAAENIDIEKSTPYPAMVELGGLLYSEGEVSVVFNPKRVKQ